MIHYLVTARHAYTIREFLTDWAPALGERLGVVTYEQLVAYQRLPLGTWVFTDLDRLPPARMAIAERAWERLSRAPVAVRTLNGPGRTLDRLGLHQALARAGINDYRADRASEPSDEYAFPVFLRKAGHLGENIGPLLRSRAELDRALRHAADVGADLDAMLIVEFRDASDGKGVYRKYGAWVVGERIVPNHIFFSEHWIVKYSHRGLAEREEEERYMEDNPHEAWLRSVCEIAGVDFGRVDYGISDGRPQVWEINTNPRVLLPPDEFEEEHRPSRRRFASRLREALEGLDSRPLGRFGVPFTLDSDTVTLLEQELEHEEDLERRGIFVE